MGGHLVCPYHHRCKGAVLTDCAFVVSALAGCLCAENWKCFAKLRGDYEAAGMSAKCTMHRERSCKVQWLYTPQRSPKSTPKPSKWPGLNGLERRASGWPSISWRSKTKLQIQQYRQGDTKSPSASERKYMLGTVLVILLVLMLIGALPTWPHSRNWGYGPTGGLGVVLTILIVLLLMGRL